MVKIYVNHHVEVYGIKIMMKIIVLKSNHVHQQIIKCILKKYKMVNVLLTVEMSKCLINIFKHKMDVIKIVHKVYGD